MSERSDTAWDRIFEKYKAETGKQPLSDWCAWEEWLAAYTGKLSIEEQSALTKELTHKGNYTSGLIAVADGRIYVRAIEDNGHTSTTYDVVTVENLNDASRVLGLWMELPKERSGPSDNEIRAWVCRLIPLEILSDVMDLLVTAMLLVKARDATMKSTELIAIQDLRKAYELLESKGVDLADWVDRGTMSDLGKPLPNPLLV